MTNKSGSPNTSEYINKDFARIYLVIFSPAVTELKLYIIICISSLLRNDIRYDIPVLHINDIYWTKHKLSEEDAIAAIEEACAGDFAMRSGEPNAGRLERY